MMQLMRGFARPPTHAQLPARRGSRVASKEARRLATALFSAMVLCASLSWMIFGTRQAGEHALAPDSAAVSSATAASDDASIAAPANGAAQADAVALAHAQAVAMADAAAENAAKDTVDVDGGVRSTRRDDEPDGEYENGENTETSASAQTVEMARAAAAARAALNDASLDDESADGRVGSEQQTAERDEGDRTHDGANDRGEDHHLPVVTQAQQSPNNDHYADKPVDNQTRHKGVGWLWGIGKKPRNKLRTGPVLPPPSVAEQSETLHTPHNNALRDASNGNGLGRPASQQLEHGLKAGNLREPVTTGASVADDSGEDEDHTSVRSHSDDQTDQAVRIQIGVRNAEIDAPPEVRNAETDYFAGYRSRVALSTRTSTSGDEDETHERLTTRDFGVVFGMAIAHSAVISAADRAHLQHHDISRDSAYQRIRSTGQMASLVARFADALENAAAGGDESAFVYVGRANDARMGYGLYAARALPAGTMLGEYGGRYVRVLPNKQPGDYVWHLPLLNVNGTDEAWAVDAAEWGNALRFCNDLGPGTWNVAARVVPWNGQWHVIYETITPVLENEQLSVAYGHAFWASRNF